MKKTIKKALFLAAVLLLASPAPSLAGYNEGVDALRKSDYQLAYLNSYRLPAAALRTLNITSDFCFTEVVASGAI